LKLEIEMTDWADGIEIRNNGIRCVMDSRVLSELLRTIVSLVMVFGALMFYSWVRSQIIDTGYESQKLFTVEQELLQIQNKLILEEETLKNPQRIDIIARGNLGMIPLHPNQLILPPLQMEEFDIPDSLAMAESEAGGMKKSAKNKRFVSYVIN
jgi:cell division protein FtsL